MIGVIADDLTGAAEIGAVSLRHGLKAEVIILSQFSKRSIARLPQKSRLPDALCIDTDSRSCSPRVAGHRAAAAARLLFSLGATWIYKKVDSVLRGHVIAELEAILKQLGRDRAMLAPSNPSLGRLIRGGHYFVKGRLINRTEFARDPEYPRTSAKVLILLGAPRILPMQLCSTSDLLPGRGIVVCEVGSRADLNHWASLHKPGILPAGGAEFWASLIAHKPAVKWAGARSRGRLGREREHASEELFICGTTSRTSHQFIQACRSKGVPVFTLPRQLLCGARFTAVAARLLANKILSALHSHRRVVLAVGLPQARDPVISRSLSAKLVRVAQEVLSARGSRSNVSPLPHVFAEGGATAMALVRRMRWSRMKVVEELALGVATLEVESTRPLRLTIKPGSYSWPRQILSE